MRKLISILLVFGFLAIGNVSVSQTTVGTKTYVGDIIAQPLFKVNLSKRYQLAPHEHFSMVNLKTVTAELRSLECALRKEGEHIEIPIYPRCNSPDM